MLAPRSVLAAAHEAGGLPRVVDRAALVVHEPGREAGLLDGVEVEVGLDLRGLLRPRDPEAVGIVERVAQRGEAPFEVCPLGVKKTTTPVPGFAPSFFESGVAE
jgi:hypothetical protein